MEKTLILYESKYGFTEMIARYLSLILGPAKYCKSTECNVDGNNYDTIVICTPIYLESVDGNILKFTIDNATWLKNKKVILLCTCLAVNLESQYLQSLSNILGDSVIYQTAITGRLVLENLDKNDYE